MTDHSKQFLGIGTDAGPSRMPGDRVTPIPRGFGSSKRVQLGCKIVGNGAFVRKKPKVFALTRVVVKLYVVEQDVCRFANTTAVA